MNPGNPLKSGAANDAEMSAHYGWDGWEYARLNALRICLSVAGDEINKADAAINKRLDEAILATNDVMAGLSARVNSLSTRVEWLASQIRWYASQCRPCAACENLKYRRGQIRGTLPGSSGVPEVPTYGFERDGIFHVHVAPALVPLDPPTIMTP